MDAGQIATEQVHEVQVRVVHRGLDAVLGRGAELVEHPERLRRQSARIVSAAPETPSAPQSESSSAMRPMRRPPMGVTIVVTVA